MQGHKIVKPFNESDYKGLDISGASAEDYIEQVFEEKWVPAEKANRTIEPDSKKECREKSFAESMHRKAKLKQIEERHIMLEEMDEFEKYGDLVYRRAVKERREKRASNRNTVTL